MHGEEQPERGLPRKERERLARRQDILRAAERVLNQRGYYGATIEEIAHEAEFAVGTLYNFFTNKEELFQEVLDSIAEELTTPLREQVYAQDDPVEALKALIRLRLEHFDRHSGFFRAAIERTPAAKVEPRLAMTPKCEELYDQYLLEVQGIFQKGIKRGLFVDLDPFYMALCFQGVLQAFIAYWLRKAPHEPVQTRAANLYDTFVASICARPVPENGPNTPRQCRENNVGTT
jgi:TetR/AcrR family transcriptional regulator